MIEQAKHPAEDIEKIIVSVADIITAIERNYHKRHERPSADQESHIFRLSPPFGEVPTATLVSVDPDTPYPPEIDPKPIHISPKAFFTGTTGDATATDELRYPTYAMSKRAFREAHEIPIGEALTPEYKDEWEAWWDAAITEWKSRVPSNLADEITLFGQYGVIADKTVPVEYTDK